MSMTKKDFELLADVLGASYEGTGPDYLDLGEEARIAVLTTAACVADELARVHPRFDRTKFLDRVAPNLTTLFPPAADG